MIMPIDDEMNDETNNNYDLIIFPYQIADLRT
jgi:hypothetical protein